MIHIITPCIRPGNLQHISPSIPNECNWIVIFDENCKPSVREADNATVITPGARDEGHYNEHYYNANWNRNYVLDNYEFKDGDWIYFLDDDNSIHPNWYKNVKDTINTNYVMIVWGQLKSNGKTKRFPKNSNNLLERNFPIAIGKIDTASFMVNYKHVKDIRWTDDPSPEEAHCSDGKYAIECSKRGEIHYIPEYICYYNRLSRRTTSLVQIDL